MKGGGRNPSPLPTVGTGSGIESDDDDYDDIADVNKFLGAPPGAATETLILERVANLLAVEVLDPDKDPDAVVKSVKDIVME